MTTLHRTSLKTSAAVYEMNSEAEVFFCLENRNSEPCDVGLSSPRACHG